MTVHYQLPDGTTFTKSYAGARPVASDESTSTSRMTALAVDGVGDVDHVDAADRGGARDVVG